MTDDAEQFYTAWISVFGQGPKKLLCTCHVDRAWRGAVKNKIQEKEVEALINIPQPSGANGCRCI